MSIDITSNISFDAGSNPLDASKKPDSDRLSQTNAADSSLGVEYEPFIRTAVGLDDSGSQAVAAAVEALESGLLDSREAIESAAEKMLLFGI
jgi:hypothetical protein